MKTFLFTSMTLVLASSAWAAATTINPVNKFSYGANIGWMDWRGDTNNGAGIGEFVCAGFLYAANVGWIHLGSNAPANGIRYQNNSATDYGVNHDGAGKLEGFAYGANIGWINFTNRDATGALFDGPKLDLVSGRLSGFVWSANCGWISLSNAQAFVQTDQMRRGPDTDGDGLPDDWERAHAGNLTTLTGGADTDTDGVTNLQEYEADTNPLNANSKLQITSISHASGSTAVTLNWSSRPSRVYRLLRRSDLNPGFSWTDVGLGTFAPSAGSVTTKTFAEPAAARRFFEVQVFMPLQP